MNSRDSSLTPLQVAVLDEPALANNPEHFISSDEYNGDVPIAIDFGSNTLKAGYTNQDVPSLVFPTRLTRFRDRRLNRTMTFIGNDISLDQAVRAQSKSPFDGSMVTNWEYIDEMLEYTFKHLGVLGDNGISNPLIFSEKLAVVQAQRSQWYQLLFETFNISKATFGIDNQFAFFANNSIDSTGLMIGCNNEDTNVIPIVNGVASLQECKRINWGGNHAVSYMNNLLSLKYPYFPTKLTDLQYQKLYHDYCYVSPDYSADIDKYLTLDVLEEKNIVVEAPFTEITQPQKSEEELRIQAEKRKETGRRLQEQAKQKRMERLIQKQEELEYYTQLKEQFIDQPKKKILSILQNAGFDDERDFKKYVSNLERSVKKAHSAELAEDDDVDEDPSANKFDLLDIPDDQLTPEQIKEKRVQRLMKANVEARQKAKEEKERIQKEEEELRKKEEEWRQSDLTGWIKDKRGKLNALIVKRKEKLKMREEMKDRKSQAAQNRMKNLATLAEDNVRQGGKRNRDQATIDNDPNDTFGADDEDWMVYNDISQNPEALDEAIEEDYKDIVEIEKELLEFDPNFTGEDTLDAQYDWRNSILHLFLRGPRPHDSDDVHEQHQMHLNIERIRVPEVLFQPTMGGCDQAGVAELCETILLKKFGSSPNQLSKTAEDMANNIWLSGGNAKVPGLKNRIVKEFTSFLPVGTKLSVNMSSDPLLDSWKGMAKWAKSEDYNKSFITKKEYEEYGPEYIKEHKMGNVAYFE
ncbi:hypothetical protein Kpol_1003p16 [Vanderwaltozyma polyspora DSM 70294]|uniref:Actin-related protein 5 n=1 Tax=Vanderwaltozyma polyspora (strain ATCC 22028 / DSM 70294 / BCRC 21397 / CBS 2163 / NBRC 10782 / NRRL Y-8283 / UCD 57-17) TaxID=436907 RepID=A7TLX4_VANPO|nr:uncharacterized protein Kpol_1003p16 [Vanderwaltozyma polyspora DSM 70294]EDO16711.1 hypothetical protein Kpol_1003p16 [Vanderwaltozyma polyspora DSM 70294]